MDTLTRMRCFIQVIESGGFSAAARDMGRSKALVSKYISELEDELGVRLLNRTTRQISATEVGQAYYREANEIIQRMDDLRESIQDKHHSARGLLRVSAPASMADGDLTEAIMAFAAAEPDIHLDLRLEDRMADLIDEGFDVAVRVSELTDSGLIARKIRPLRTQIGAAPALLEKYGMPSTPADLAQLPCIIDTNFRFRSNWPFIVDGKKSSFAVKGRVEVNGVVPARIAAERGLGFVRALDVFLSDSIADGKLVPVLEEYESDGPAMYAMYPHRRHLSAKVRRFVDFLAAWYQGR